MTGYNGAGVYVRARDWTDDKAAGIKVRADYMDVEMDAMATALSNAICRDGQSTITANLNMSNHKLTGLPAGTTAGDSVRYEQVSLLTAANAFTGINTFTNTTDSNAVQIAVFQGDRATPTDGDHAYLSFKLSDDGGTQKEVARINWHGADISAGTDVDGLISFEVMSAGSLTRKLLLNATALYPQTNDDISLGSSVVAFSNLYLATGGIIDFGAGDVTITGNTNAINFANASFGYLFDNVVRPVTNDAAGLGTAAVSWADLFLATGGQINWGSSDVVITHSANTLSFTGASSGYNFDAAITAPGISGTGASTITITTAATSLTLESTDSGAVIGPGLTIYRNSSTPASSDGIGFINFNGRDSAGNIDTYARIYATISDPLSTSEDGQVVISVMSAGTIADGVQVTGAMIAPYATDGAALGSAGVMWSDLFLASGAVVNFNAGNYTLTHSAGVLTANGAFSVGASAITSGSHLVSSNDAGALGASGTAWSDLFLASGGVINWLAGDVTITHAANTLTFGGASSGYIFDAVIKPSANDGFALGVSGTAFADLFLASGGVVNFSAGDVTITHSASTLTFAGATSGYVFDGPTSWSSAAAGTLLTLTSSDAGAASGPNIYLYRNSVTPAAADTIGGIYFQGKDSAAGVDVYSRIYTVIDDPLSTSEDASLYVGVVTAGSLTDGFKLNGTALSPVTNDGLALGTTALMFSDLFLASGGVINFNAGNYTITHTAGLLTASGALTVTGAIIGSSTLSIGAGVFTAGTIEIGNATDATIGRSGAGDITVEGNRIFRVGGADVPVADGGTGASTAAAAITTLMAGLTEDAGTMISTSLLPVQVSSTWNWMRAGDFSQDLMALFGSTKGMILYHDGSIWRTLAPP